VDAARSDESKKQRGTMLSRHRDRNNGPSDPGRGEKIGGGVTIIAQNQSRKGSVGGTTGSSGAHLGDILDLGEPECHPEAAKEHEDESAGVAGGSEAELPAIDLYATSVVVQRAEARGAGQGRGVACGRL
jgi:hypothetical protein